MQLKSIVDDTAYIIVVSIAVDRICLIPQTMKASLYSDMFCQNHEIHSDSIDVDFDWRICPADKFAHLILVTL